jgi:hypothetical protein
MAINFNTEPYYDDFSEDKKFYRILYRPGYAVQARELTQMQTILQNQIGRFGDHIFKEGAMVIPGQISVDQKAAYIKLEQKLFTTNSLQTLMSQQFMFGIKILATIKKLKRSPTVKLLLMKMELMK